MRDPTPAEQLFLLTTSTSSRWRSRGGYPGEVLLSFPEDSPVRQRLRELKSSDIAKDAPYVVGPLAEAPPRERRGRFNVEMPRCKVPGCMLLRPTWIKDIWISQDGTCLRHLRGSVKR